MVQAIKTFIGKVLKFIKYTFYTAVVGVVLMIALGSYINANDPEYQAKQAAIAEQRAVEEAAVLQAEAEAEAEAKKLAEAKAEAKRIKGFHCLSGWDGSHRQVARAVEKSLRDPDSFKHKETKIWPKSMDGNDTHTLLMTYSGKNGFGGTTVERVTAKISHATCDVITIEKV
jgi:hypothetical protein